MEIATIHASGADLIEGRNLTMMASQHTWQTSCVLLSELSAPVSFEQRGHRPLTDDGTGVQRLDAPPTPRNVIVGADWKLQMALAGGTRAIAEHLAQAEAGWRRQWLNQIDTDVET